MAQSTDLGIILVLALPIGIAAWLMREQLLRGFDRVFLGGLQPRAKAAVLLAMGFTLTAGILDILGVPGGALMVNVVGGSAMALVGVGLCVAFVYLVDRVSPPIRS